MTSQPKQTAIDEWPRVRRFIVDGFRLAGYWNQRGEHVINPHTSRPPTGVLSVTITGPDLATADAYATTAFAMGTRAAQWTATLGGYEAMTILADGRVLLTQGFLAGG